MHFLSPAGLLLATLLATLASAAPAQSMLTIPALFARDHVWTDDRTLWISVPGGLLRYDVETGQALAPLNFGVQPMYLDLSPDGTRVAVSDWNRFDSETQFHLVDVATSAVQTVRFPRGFLTEEGTYSLVWLDNRTLRITAEGNGQLPVRLYDTQTQTVTTSGSLNHGALLSTTPDRSVVVQLTRNQTPGRVDYLVDNQIVASTDINLPSVFAIGVKPDASWFVLPQNGSTPARAYRRAGAGFELRAFIGSTESGARQIRSLRYLPTRAYAISADSLINPDMPAPGITLRNAESLRIIELLDEFAFATGVDPDRQGRISVSPGEQRIAVTTLDEVRVLDIGEFLFHSDFDTLD